MQSVVTLTGGGSGAFEKLLHMGGASSWFLEGNIPYSKNSLQEFLKYEPEKCCSAETARKLALRSFQRAFHLGATKDQAQGVGATATLALAAGEDERIGRKHRLFVAIQSYTTTKCFSFCLDHLKSRIDQEVEVSNIIYDIAKCYNFHRHQLIQADDTLGLGDMLLGAIGYKFTGEISPKVNPVIYSGSFNPIHLGHSDVVHWANMYLGRKPYLEMSLTNPDKQPLDYIDVSERTRAIEHKVGHMISGVIISNTPKFVDKSYRYLSPIFIVGADTYNRIFDLNYYKTYEDILDTVDHFKANNTKFFVLDRKGYTPYNHYIEKYGLENVVMFVPKEEYEDKDGISSSKIRKALEYAP